MRRIIGIITALAAMAASAVPFATASAQAPSAPPPAAAAAAPRVRGGYLPRDAVPDFKVFLPAPPADAAAFGVADAAVFTATRALEGTARWQLAQHDNEIGHKTLLGDFSCAVGVDLSTAETPALSRLIQRSSANLFPLVGDAKDEYQRPRPFLRQQGPVCITPSEDFAKSGSYPSGHSAGGWLYALLLADVDSSRAAAILARGRAFGESRVVCGVHYVSDIEGGRLTASALFAALQGNAEFAADVAAARTELASLRTRGPQPTATACAAEGANLKTPW